MGGGGGAGGPQDVLRRELDRLKSENGRLKAAVLKDSPAKLSSGGGRGGGGGAARPPAAPLKALPWAAIRTVKEGETFSITQHGCPFCASHSCSWGADCKDKGLYPSRAQQVRDGPYCVLGADPAKIKELFDHWAASQGSAPPL